MHKGGCFLSEPPGKGDPEGDPTDKERGESAVSIGTSLEMELNGLGCLGEGVMTKPWVRSVWLASADICYFSSPCL